MSCERDRSIDMLKGFGILLMVIDHVRFGNITHTWISSFHMPLFFIISGYLFRDKPYKLFLQKRWKSLWIPYFIFGIVFLMLSIAVDHNRDFILSQLIGLFLVPTSKQRMVLSAPLWFIPCIFWIEFVFLFLTKNIRNKWCFGASVIVIGAFGVVYPVLKLPSFPFSLGPAAFAILFYFIGFLIRKLTDKGHKILQMSPLVMTVLVILGSVSAYYNGVTDIRSANYGLFILFLISGTSLTLFFWSVFRFLNEKAKKCVLCGFFAYYGNNSMLLLCCNYAVIKLLKRIFAYFRFFEDNSFVLNCLIFCLTILIITGFEKILKRLNLTWLFGKQRSENA